MTGKDRTPSHPVRRTLIAAAASACLPLPNLLSAQPAAWPTRPIRFLVGYSAGGSTDIIGRLVAEPASKRLGQPITVMNQPGASGTMAALQVARADADGYTFMVCASPEISVVPLTMSLQYDPVKDFAPVILIGQLPYFLVVHPSLPVQNLAEFIEYGRKNPDRLNFSSSGNNTSNHLASEAFIRAAGIKAAHVPYQGTGQALQDLMAGQIQFTFDTAAALKPHVQSGRLRALGVSADRRLVGAPSVPTLAEAGMPGFVAGTWVGIVAPAATPKGLIERLNSEIVAVLREPAMRQTLVDRDLLVAGGSPDEFGAFIRKELNDRRLALAGMNGPGTGAGR